LVATALVEVSQATPDLGRFPQRLVEIFKVKDGRLFVRGDEIKGCARVVSAGLGGFTISMHSFRQTPRPHGGKPSAHLAQHDPTRCSSAERM
jgi:hypothetical protein